MRAGWVGLGLVLGACGLAAPARGQLAVYGKFDLLHDTQNENNNGIVNQVKTTFYYGGGVGAYDDFLHVGPLRLGLDVRGDLLTGNSYHYRDVLGGVRLAAKLPVLPFRPYVQGSIGSGGTKYTGMVSVVGSQYANKFTYVVFAGLDTGLLPHVDFRAIEVGVGKQSGVSDVPGAPKPALVFVSTGLVVRF